MDATKIDSIVELAADIAGKADVIEDVLVLYTVKGEPGAKSLDNGVAVGDALFLMAAFNHWLMTRVNEPQK